MIENVMHEIVGTNVFGIVSICIFVAFFTGMFFWEARLKKSYLDSMCELPLDEDETKGQPTSEEPHE